jgi:hypothetical protein
MKIYNYDKNGEHVSTTKARKNPRKPDSYMIPANATTTAPPEVDEGQVAVFDGGQWLVKTDNRGQKYYTADGVEHTLSEIGEELPENYSLTEKPSSVHELVDNKWVINLELQQKLLVDNAMSMLNLLMDKEAQDTKYFGGHGFINGMASVRKYVGLADHPYAEQANLLNQIYLDFVAWASTEGLSQVDSDTPKESVNELLEYQLSVLLDKSKRQIGLSLINQVFNQEIANPKYFGGLGYSGLSNLRNYLVGDEDFNEEARYLNSIYMKLIKQGLELLPQLSAGELTEEDAVTKVGQALQTLLSS